MIKPFHLIIISSILLSSIAFSQPNGNLKHTVKSFIRKTGNSKVTEDDYVNNLKVYFDPNTNTDSIALEYYDYWVEQWELNSFAKKSKLIDINVAKEKGTADIKSIWHSPNGNKYLFITRTYWIYTNGKWFRTIEDGTLLEKRKL
jgi:hypothetical protein